MKKTKDSDMLSKLTNIRHVSQYGLSHDIVESQANELSRIDGLIAQSVSKYHNSASHQNALNADAILNPDTHSERIIGVKYSKELNLEHQILFKNINDEIINDHKLEQSISSWVEDALIDGSKPIMINKLNFDVLKAVSQIVNTQNPHTIQLDLMRILLSILQKY